MVEKWSGNTCALKNPLLAYQGCPYIHSGAEGLEVSCRFIAGQKVCKAVMEKNWTCRRGHDLVDGRIVSRDNFFQEHTAVGIAIAAATGQRNPLDDPRRKRVNF